LQTWPHRSLSCWRQFGSSSRLPGFLRNQVAFLCPRQLAAKTNTLGNASRSYRSARRYAGFRGPPATPVCARESRLNKTHPAEARAASEGTRSLHSEGKLIRSNRRSGSASPPNSLGSNPDRRANASRPALTTLLRRLCVRLRARRPLFNVSQRDPGEVHLRDMLGPSALRNVPAFRPQQWAALSRW